jgi:hypothetical protein
VNSDRIEQDKKEATLLLIYGFQKGISILCHVKCYGRCWLASGWRDASCDAYNTIRINHPSEGVTSSFKCQQSVKQGCPISPLLFGLYLDGLERHLDNKECDAPTLIDVHIWLLLFADDLTLTSELEVGLQQQLDTF